MAPRLRGGRPPPGFFAAGAIIELDAEPPPPGPSFQPLGDAEQARWTCSTCSWMPRWTRSWIRARWRRFGSRRTCRWACSSSAAPSCFCSGCCAGWSWPISAPPPRSGPSAGGGPPAATLSAPRLLRDVGDACHADARQGGPHPPDVVRYASEFVLETFVPLPSLYEAEAACDIDSVEGHSSEELLCAMASLAPRVARSVLSLLVDGCA